MSAVGQESCSTSGCTSDGTTELRIRQNEILRESVETQHRTVDSERQCRKAFVSRPWECSVIQLRYLSRQRSVVAIGEVAPQRGVVSQMQRSGLSNAVEISADGSKPGAGDVNASEHLIQQR